MNAIQMVTLTAYTKKEESHTSNYFVNVACKEMKMIEILVSAQYLALSSCARRMIILEKCGLVIIAIPLIAIASNPSLNVESVQISVPWHKLRIILLMLIIIHTSKTTTSNACLSSFLTPSTTCSPTLC